MSQEIKLAFPIMEEFIVHREASQCWCNSYHEHLKSFSKFCKETYPNHTEISQEMIDNWCSKRKTENNNSRKTRIYVVVNFVKYINIKSDFPLKVPCFSKTEKTHYKPHIFTAKELTNLFYACDNIKVVRNRRTTILRKMIMPVLFRLMYSTGMRTLEIVYLKKDDVNFDTGVINIQKSKGYNQHYIVMHDSIKEIMKNYDKEIEKIFPTREYFFPTKDNGHNNRTWITGNFRKLWDMYNADYARAYDLRHNYAIANINSWYNIGIEFNSKLLALSKSMGHASIKSTMYYYTLVPGLADKLEELTNRTFDELIPGAENEE